MHEDALARVGGDVDADLSVEHAECHLERGVLEPRDVVYGDLVAVRARIAQPEATTGLRRVARVGRFPARREDLLHPLAQLDVVERNLHLDAERVTRERPLRLPLPQRHRRSMIDPAHPDPMIGAWMQCC